MIDMGKALSEALTEINQVGDIPLEKSYDIYVALYRLVQSVLYDLQQNAHGSITITVQPVRSRAEFNKENGIA